MEQFLKKTVPWLLLGGVLVSFWMGVSNKSNDQDEFEKTTEANSIDIQMDLRDRGNIDIGTSRVPKKLQTKKRPLPPWVNPMPPFKDQFHAFREYNPKAYSEAEQNYKAFIELQGVAGSYSLYDNLLDLRSNCLNALQSIVVSLDNRNFVNALMERIHDFDKKLLQGYLSYYRTQLNALPRTTSSKEDLWYPGKVSVLPADTTGLLDGDISRFSFIQ
jgi:hypothetical protein